MITKDVVPTPHHTGLSTNLLKFSIFNDFRILRHYTINSIFTWWSQTKIWNTTWSKLLFILSLQLSWIHLYICLSSWTLRRRINIRSIDFIEHVFISWRRNILIKNIVTLERPHSWHHRFSNLHPYKRIMINPYLKYVKIHCHFRLILTINGHEVFCLSH